jgi:hypothetical protein
VSLLIAVEPIMWKNVLMLVVAVMHVGEDDACFTLQGFHSLFQNKLL